MIIFLIRHRILHLLTIVLCSALCLLPNLAVAEQQFVKFKGEHRVLLAHPQNQAQLTHLKGQLAMLESEFSNRNLLVIVSWRNSVAYFPTKTHNLDASEVLAPLIVMQKPYALYDINGELLASYQHREFTVESLFQHIDSTATASDPPESN